MSAPLYGLVLAGGASRRMHSDKAALMYHGATQLAQTMQLLTPLVERAFVSVRADQIDEPLRAAFARIVDRAENLGPLAGIMAAQAEHPDVAWLVVACDLPFLDASTLQSLIRARDPARLASAYRSATDAEPEPLCAIYEPASRALIESYAHAGGKCPRRFLAGENVQLLPAVSRHALDNINTREEYEQAKNALQAPLSKNLRVHYYALMREQAGLSVESLASRARNPRDLYAELKARHPFSLPLELLKVAVNDEFSDWSHPLAEGDSIVFIPPVAGG